MANERIRYTPKEARKKVRATQTDIAYDMGVTLKTYRKYEANPKKMTIEQALAFCKSVEMKPSEILFGLE